MLRVAQVANAVSTPLMVDTLSPFFELPFGVASYCRMLPLKVIAIVRQDSMVEMSQHGLGTDARSANRALFIDFVIVPLPY